MQDGSDFLARLELADTSPFTTIILQPEAKAWTWLGE